VFRADHALEGTDPALGRFANFTAVELAMARKVLAIGIDPAFIDYTAMPQFTGEMFRGYIDAQIERVRTAGFDVTSCLIDLGDTAEAVTTQALKSQAFDCVLIGAGLRQPGERVPLLEKVLNLVHRLAPAASICFNTNPADSLEAVQRWITPST
jgi:hypothetical protein